jgi:glycosyltransferase involved in cell wall biosynthesis
LGVQIEPLISVIMPVYNSVKFLPEAVESLLAQTLSDFELIVIDDGSTDGSAALLESFCQKDTRLIVQRHPHNQGITAARNTGLAQAHGKYIAFMDSDDISLPERFEKQVAFLENHPEIDILGSSVVLIDERGQKIGALSAPLDDLAIHWAGFFSASFLHPTIMLRHSILMQHAIHYRVARDQSEDYDFFSQLLEYACGANYPEPLYVYRVHSASMTSQFQREKINSKSALILANLKKHFPGLAISHDQVRQVSAALLGKPSGLGNRAAAADIYLQVWQAFSKGCTPGPTFYRLRAEVTLIGAKLTLYPPFQPGWRKSLYHLSEIEPHWYLLFAKKFPRMFSTKIQTVLIRKNRK